MLWLEYLSDIHQRIENRHLIAQCALQSSLGRSSILGGLLMKCTVQPDILCLDLHNQNCNVLCSCALLCLYLLGYMNHLLFGFAPKGQFTGKHRKQWAIVDFVGIRGKELIWYIPMFSLRPFSSLLFRVSPLLFPPHPCQLHLLPSLPHSHTHFKVVFLLLCGAILWSYFDPKILSSLFLLH